MAEQGVVLTIDAGTTGVTTLMVASDGAIVARGYCEFEQHYPQPGWVEHDPEQIWQAVITAVKQAFATTDLRPATLGVTNQRETIVLWHRGSLKAARRAIVWQDRRGTDIVAELRAAELEPMIRTKTGLGLDPYFSSSKCLWISRSQPELWKLVKSGEILIGTVDSYLVARLTAGASHLTDASNASRTQLFNLESLNWDAELLALFDVPIVALPKVVASYGQLAITDAQAFFGLEIPITSIIGDQQAALFGQLAFSVGDSKCTYGTGAFILQNTGSTPVASHSGLLTTVAWLAPDGKPTFALEGSVFVAGSAVQWLRDGLGIIKTAAEVEALASEVPDSGGVVFVPALTGIGAPHWNPKVRGCLFGISRGTSNAHIARATLEAIGFQIREVMDSFERDTGNRCSALRVDGGASSNDLLLQLQANILGTPVERRKVIESTAYGAALMAGLGFGFWASTDELLALNPVASRFAPQAFEQLEFAAWKKAVSLSIAWSE